MTEAQAINMILRLLVLNCVLATLYLITGIGSMIIRAVIHVKLSKTTPKQSKQALTLNAFIEKLQQKAEAKHPKMCAACQEQQTINQPGDTIGYTYNDPDLCKECNEALIGKSKADFKPVLPPDLRKGTAKVDTLEYNAFTKCPYCDHVDSDNYSTFVDLWGEPAEWVGKIQDCGECHRDYIINTVIMLGDGTNNTYKGIEPTYNADDLKIVTVKPIP